MGAQYNKEGDPIAYFRDKDEPVGSAAFKKIDPYTVGRDHGDERHEGVYGTRPACTVTVENARPDNFNATLEEAKLREEQAKIMADYAPTPVEPLRSSCYPSTLTELVYFVQRFFGKGIDIIREKNQRYAGAIDPFKNFRLGGQYGIAIRMSDKVSRLLTLLEPGTTITATADESIEDTCQDLANYCAILSAMRRNEGR